VQYDYKYLKTKEIMVENIENVVNFDLFGNIYMEYLAAPDITQSK